MKKKTLYLTVYQKIRYQILSGEWLSGTKLPPERKLADELQVSRNTIVRAYEDLEDEGLIISKVGSGRYVKPLPPLPDRDRRNWKQQLEQEKMVSNPSFMTQLHTMLRTKPSINFAFGEGGKHTLETNGFGKDISMERILDSAEADYMIPIHGHPDLRKWIVEWMSFENVTSSEQILITSGSQEALQLTTSILARPGDSIVVEMPTYLGALHLFQTLGFHIIPVPLDEKGMRVDALEGILSRTQPRFIYTNPTFHNPTGTVLTMERRLKLLYLSEKHGIPIIEDDAYRSLYFQTEPPMSLKALDRFGNVIYISTFSKVLFPGLRLGWVTANRPFMERLIRHKELSQTTNTFAQHGLLLYLKKHTFTKHLEYLRKVYETQAQTMVHCLQSIQKIGASLLSPSGGFYIWLALPEQIRPKELLIKSIEHGVVFLTGEMFMYRDVEQPFIRLSYSHETSEKIMAGMQKLENLMLDLA